MSAAEKIVVEGVAYTLMEACPLARTYRWYSPIQDWAKRRTSVFDDTLHEHQFARPVLRVHPQQEKEEGSAPSSPTPLLQDSGVGESSRRFEHTVPPTADVAPEIVPRPLAAPHVHRRGPKASYASHQRVDSVVNMSSELKSWLERQRKYDESALDDTIRRLCGFAPRSPV